MRPPLNFLPNSTDALLSQANALLSAQRYHEALAIYERAAVP